MIERYIYHAIVDGAAKITAQPRILEALFLDFFDLSVTEVAAIQKAWLQQPLNVVQGYPRVDGKFPQASIVLSTENEVQTYLGDVAGQVTDEEDEACGADVKSAIWQHQYIVMMVTENPDLTLYYYQILKSIILNALGYFTDRGLFAIQVGGQDLVPDPAYLPEHLWVRQLTFGCQSEFIRLDIDSLATKAWQVGGIHVDSQGSPQDTGGVKTQVTTYVEGEPDDETET
jgi:hypothetical protein